jgi:glucosyl-3-phosphoglycerate phosphatase
MNLILVRHAQSEANARRLIISNHPDHLTQHGREQTVALANNLAMFRPFDVYSSPSTRCMETASILSQASEVTVSELLKERALGQFDGMPLDSLVNLRKQLKHQFLDPTQDWEGVQEVEQDGSIYRRFLEFIDKLEQPSNHHKLIVTHAGFVKAVISQALAIPSTRQCILKIPNASYTLLERVDSIWLLRAFSRL